MLFRSAAAQEGGPNASKQSQEGRALMQDVAKAYKDAPTLTDKMELDIKTPMGNQKVTMDLQFGKGTDAIVSFQGMRMTALGDSFYVEDESVSDKYVKMPLEGNLADTLTSLGGGRSSVPVQAAMRTGFDIDKDLGMLTVGLLPKASIVGLDDVEKGGKSWKKVTLEGDRGTADVFVDPNTNLMHNIEMTLTPGQGASGMQLNATITFDPQVRDELPQSIAFKTEGRKEVDSLQKLQPTPISTGDKAPDFELKTAGGESVKLSDLRGKVVVLDFWATWCKPCKRALPMLEEFHKWTKSDEKPVQVFAVNTFERAPDNDKILKNVRKYWTDNEFTMKTLMDYDSGVAQQYGLSSIPVTIVVGPDGNVAAVHKGYNDKMVEQLKTDVNSAMNTRG